MAKVKVFEMNDKLMGKYHRWQSKWLLLITVFILICAVVLMFPLRHRFASNPKEIVERFICSYNSNDAETFFSLQMDSLNTLITSKVTQQASMKFIKGNIGANLTRITPIEEIANDDYAKGRKDFRVFSFKCQGVFNRQHELRRLTIALKKGYFGWKIAFWNVEED